MGSVTQCLELSTGNMQCVAMILLAGATLSHSSTDVKVSAHDPQSGLPYSYSITTIDTVPTPADTTGYNTLPYTGYPYPGLPYGAPQEVGDDDDQQIQRVPALAGYAGYPAYSGYSPYAGYGGYPAAGNPWAGYAGLPAGYNGLLAVPAAPAV